MTELYSFSVNTNHPNPELSTAKFSFKTSKDGQISDFSAVYGGKEYNGVKAQTLAGSIGAGSMTFGGTASTIDDLAHAFPQVNSMVQTRNTIVTLVQKGASQGLNQEPAQGMSAELQKEAVAAVLNSGKDSKYNAVDSKFMQEKLAEQANQRVS